MLEKGIGRSFQDGSIRPVIKDGQAEFGNFRLGNFKDYSHSTWPLYITALKKKFILNSVSLLLLRSGTLPYKH